MQIRYFEPMSAPDLPNTSPFIRSSHGEGCGLGTCKCSEGFWISISDGKQGVQFIFETKDEMNMFKYHVSNLENTPEVEKFNPSQR